VPLAWPTVTHAANHRALERLERTSGAKDDGWLKAVYALDRERRAALALAKFAQELAGVEPPALEPVRDEPPPPRAHPFAAPPPPRRPVWGPNNRPGPHDVLTWEEVMQVPWIEGEDSILR
jgi:hypothetical protein